MKILKLHLKNINSLQGVHTIDFSKFEDGIFLISGETGSGKTTILDAISLALYGETPRVKRQKNVLITKGTNDLFSELHFEISKKIYISKFSISKTKDPHMEISTGGKILEQGLRKVQSYIFDLIGLQFTQFIRSVLLAQGSFDSFLKTNDSEKAEILEKLTDSTIYRKISIKVEEKFTEISKKIDSNKNITENYKPTPESEIFEKISNIQTEIDNLNLEKLSNQISELQNLETQKDVKNDNLKKILSLGKHKKSNLDRTKNKIEDLKNINKNFNLELQNIDFFISQNSFLLDLKNEFSEISNRTKDISKEKENLDRLKISKDLSEIENRLSKIEHILESENLSKHEKEILNLIDFQKLSSQKIEIESELKILEPQNLELKNKLEGVSEIFEQISQKRESELMILNYERERANLITGEPCPICGSTEHPLFSETPNIDETERVWKKYKKEVERFTHDLQILSQKVGILKNQQDQTLAELENRNFQNLIHGEIDKLILEKKRKIQFLEDLKKEEIDLFKERKNSEKYSILKERYEAEIIFIKQKFEKYKVKDLRELEKKLNEILLNEKEQSRFKNEIFINSKTLKNLETGLLDLKHDIEIERENYKNMENEISELSAQIEKYPDLETIKREALEKDRLKNELVLEKGELHGFSKENRKKRETYENSKKELEILKSDFEEWSRLNYLIGSKSGGKYQKIAQEKTLQMLLILANSHLSKMSNRYQLKRTHDLQLSVIDKFYGDHIREIYTLSGGETFLISLSLALALSDFSSENIEINSLFLDEGFGTLDEESLEIVLSALNSLQSRGKSIGVISHIKLLKERIYSQVVVKKVGNGFSEIEIL